MATAKDIDLPIIKKNLSYNSLSGKLHWLASRGKAKKGDEAGSMGQFGYLKIQLHGRYYIAHRLAWALHYNCQPPAIIDHINGCKDDNRIDNLRDGTNSLNQQNQVAAHSGNKNSKKLGVSIFNGKWRAKIFHKGKYYFLGYYSSEDDASQAYIEAKRKLHNGCML